MLVNSFLLIKRNLKMYSSPHWHRRLKQGDLVAYVLNGDFDHILNATVVSLFSTSMRTGSFLDCFSVAFLTEESDECCSVDILNSLIQTGNTLAVLCPTYYNEFKPVLEALQVRNPDALPFKEELVSCVFECQDCTTTGEHRAVTQAEMPSTYEPFQPCLSTESSDAIKSTEPTGTGPHIKAVERHVMDVEDTIDYGAHTSSGQNDGDMVTTNPAQTMETFGASRAFRRLQHLRFQRSDKYKRTFLPSYIQPGDTCIDWSVIFAEELKTSSATGVSNSIDYRRDLQSANFEVLRQLFTSDLDESQLDAVELALHNRVTVIQGPPGTGKTFIGYKLVKLLLSVSTLPKGPIVVLSCKNHSLNEFLKGCGESCEPGSKKVIRVGGKKQDVVGNVAHLSELCRLPSRRLGEHPAGKLRDICDIVPAVIEHLPGEMLRAIIRQTTKEDFLFPGDQLVAALSDLEDLPDDEMKKWLLHTAKEWPATYRTEQPPYASITEDCKYSKGIHPTSRCMSYIASACAIRSVAFQMVYWFHNNQTIHDLLMEQSRYMKNPADEFLSELRAAFTNYSIPVDEDDLVDVNTGVVEHQLHAGAEGKEHEVKQRVYFSAKQTASE